MVPLAMLLGILGVRCQSCNVIEFVQYSEGAIQFTSYSKVISDDYFRGLFIVTLSVRFSNGFHRVLQ